jgi:nitrous oxidase accessory protein NosD
MTMKHKRPALGLAALIAGVAAASTVLVTSAAVAAPPPCQAKNVGTGVEYKGASALANAIVAASAGDTISVWGTCYGNFRVNQDLTLRGQGKNATLDGNKQGRVLRIGGGTVTVRDLEITNGQTTSLGGGIYVGTAAVLIRWLWNYPRAAAAAFTRPCPKRKSSAPDALSATSSTTRTLASSSPGRVAATLVFIL